MTDPFDISELRSCPFCGGEAWIDQDHDEWARWVTCSKCEADGPRIRHPFHGKKEESRKFVVDAWNKRQGGAHESPRQEIVRIARTYGHAGCEPGTHRFCRLVEAIGAMGEREQEHLLQELRGGA